MYCVSIHFIICEFNHQISYITYVFYFQFREILLECQANMNEQVRQARYESDRKVQKYYLKCLHQLVNGGTNSQESIIHVNMIIVVVVYQMLLEAQNIGHLILNREPLIRTKLQKVLIIHTEDLSVLATLSRTFNRCIIP